MLAMVAYRRKVHSVCGLHDSVAKTDPSITLVDEVCPNCRAIEVELRARAEREREADEAAGPGEPHASDGRTTHVQMISPADAKAGAS